MNKMRTVYSIAALLFALGLFVTFRAVQSTRQMQKRMDRKLTDLRNLRVLAEQSHDHLALVATFEQLAFHSPRPLTEIARIAGVPHPAVRRREAVPAAGGWNLLVMAATFEDIPLANLSAFIREAGSPGDYPPWQLVECNITAIDQGRGRAELIMTALEKPGPDA